MTIPAWGERGCPLLPESLRIAWAAENLPRWVTGQLGLPDGETYSSLDADLWSKCSHPELPDQIKRFLINSIALRRASISALRIFTRAWPPAVDPAALPWSKRTRTCLRNAGLLSDATRLSTVTYGDLLSIR